MKLIDLKRFVTWLFAEEPPPAPILEKLTDTLSYNELQFFIESLSAERQHLKTLSERLTQLSQHTPLGDAPEKSAHFELRETPEHAKLLTELKTILDVEHLDKLDVYQVQEIILNKEKELKYCSKLLEESKKSINTQKNQVNIFKVIVDSMIKDLHEQEPGSAVQLHLHEKFNKFSDTMDVNELLSYVADALPEEAEGLTPAILNVNNAFIQFAVLEMIKHGFPVLSLMSTFGTFFGPVGYKILFRLVTNPLDINKLLSQEQIRQKGDEFLLEVARAAVQRGNKAMIESLPDSDASSDFETFQALKAALLEAVLNYQPGEDAPEQQAILATIQNKFDLPGDSQDILSLAASAITEEREQTTNYKDWLLDKYGIEINQSATPLIKNEAFMQHLIEEAIRDEDFITIKVICMNLSPPFEQNLYDSIIVPAAKHNKTDLLNRIINYKWYPRLLLFDDSIIGNKLETVPLVNKDTLLEWAKRDQIILLKDILEGKPPRSNTKEPWLQNVRPRIPSFVAEEAVELLGQKTPLNFKSMELKLLLEKIESMISSKADWEFGVFGSRYSITPLNQKKRNVPEGIYSIWNILKDPKVGNEEKLEAITKVVNEKKNDRRLSTFTLGLWKKRTENTKNFYASIDSLLSKFKQSSPELKQKSSVAQPRL